MPRTKEKIQKKTKGQKKNTKKYKRVSDYYETLLYFFPFVFFLCFLVLRFLVLFFPGSSFHIFAVSNNFLHLKPIDE